MSGQVTWKYTNFLLIHTICFCCCEWSVKNKEAKLFTVILVTFTNEPTPHQKDIFTHLTTLNYIQ